MPAWLHNTSAGYLRYRARAMALEEVASPSRLAVTSP
jgi:hypothetical protein